MTSLRERKTKLSFETDREMRYRGKSRAIVVMPQPFYCSVRLKGTRQVFDIAWDTIYMKAAQIAAEKARAERKGKREGKRT
jgi:hypothetical protein